MLWYEYVSEFNIILSQIDIIELIGWISVCFLMFYVAILFYKDSHKLNKLFIYIFLFFLLFVGARIARMISKFYIGEPPGDPMLFSGPLVISQSVYNMMSYIGLFFLYYTLEKSILKKTHFVFCGLVIFCTVLSFINYMITDRGLYEIFFYIIMIVYILILIGIPLVFLNLAIKSSGSVRTNSLLVTIGIVLFAFGVAFDIPEARILWQNLGEGFVFTIHVAAPIMSFVGVVLIRKGFPREI